MGAITPSAYQVESMGSMKLLIATITTASASDTWTIDKNSPVVSFWAQSNAGAGLGVPDITFTPSTGVFLLTGGTAGYGQLQMFVLQRS